MTTSHLERARRQLVGAYNSLSKARVGLGVAEPTLDTLILLACQEAHRIEREVARLRATDDERREVAVARGVASLRAEKRQGAA